MSRYSPEQLSASLVVYRSVYIARCCTTRGVSKRSSGLGSVLGSRCRRLSDLSGRRCGRRRRLGVVSGRLRARRRRLSELCSRRRRLGSLSGRVLALARRTAVKLLHAMRLWLRGPLSLKVPRQPSGSALQHRSGRTAQDERSQGLY